MYCDLKKMAATLKKSAQIWHVWRICSRFVKSLYNSYQSFCVIHALIFVLFSSTCSSYMLNALITLPIMYVLHQHVSSIVYLHLLHLYRKWLLKVLCFNMIVKNIVYCEPFNVQPNAQSSSMGSIYHVLHHTLTVNVIRDFNPFIMHRRYTPVNMKWTVCVSRQHKLLHKQRLSASEVWRQQTSWAITSINIYFA